jgi:hypothetical protein
MKGFLQQRTMNGALKESPVDIHVHVHDHCHPDRSTQKFLVLFSRVAHRRGALEFGQVILAICGRFPCALFEMSLNICIRVLNAATLIVVESAHFNRG